MKVWVVSSSKGDVTLYARIKGHGGIRWGDLAGATAHHTRINAHRFAMLAATAQRPGFSRPVKQQVDAQKIWARRSAS